MSQILLYNIKKWRKRMGVYTEKNKDGWICSFDTKTHRCIGCMLATGDDVEYYKKHYKEWIGQLDPQYEKSKGA